MPPLSHHPQPTGVRQVHRLDAPSLVLLAVWVLSMIGLPIVRWTLGDNALRAGIVTAVLAQIITVLAILAGSWGWQRTALVTLLVTSCAWAAEALGSQTGFPFGEYDYTGLLQPQLVGVPLLIPLAWMMMLPPAWAMAQLILGGARGRHGWLAYALVSALAMTAWDLFLDPQMVAWGFWLWEQPGGYFGIPWVNFLGWLLVSALITLLARPDQLPLPGLVTVYSLTWALETIGQFFFWGLPGPALVGCLGMGLVIATAWYRVRKAAP